MNKVGTKVKGCLLKKEKVRLICVGEPFKHNNKCVVNIYFIGNRSTRKMMQD